jgi:hypothetical protein
MSKSRADMTPEELEAFRKEQRERKQRSRDKSRAERERQKQIVTEQNDPLKRWERNRAENPKQYAEILQRRDDNLDDLAWLEADTALLRAGKDVSTEDLLNVAASALLNIEAYVYDDHLYCPTDWLQEFQFAYESNLTTHKNDEYYLFGVKHVRVPRDLWLEFCELAGAYVKRVMPDWEQDETARRVAAAMKPPVSQVDRGAMRECPSCHVLANSRWIPDSIWNEYEKKGCYRCHKCRDAERKLRQATIQPTTIETIFDSHGRVKDQ